MKDPDIEVAAALLAAMIEIIEIEEIAMIEIADHVRATIEDSDGKRRRVT